MIMKGPCFKQDIENIGAATTTQKKVARTMRLGYFKQMECFEGN